MLSGGKFAFLLWLTLPDPVTVGGFRFVPVQAGDPEPVVGAEIAETVKLRASR